MVNARPRPLAFILLATSLLQRQPRAAGPAQRRSRVPPAVAVTASQGDHGIDAEQTADADRPTHREEPFSALRSSSAHDLAQRKLSDAPWHGSDECRGAERALKVARGRASAQVASGADVERVTSQTRRDVKRSIRDQRRRAGGEGECAIWRGSCCVSLHDAQPRLPASKRATNEWRASRSLARVDNPQGAAPCL